MPFCLRRQSDRSGEVKNHGLQRHLNTINILQRLYPDLIYTELVCVTWYETELINPVVTHRDTAVIQRRTPSAATKYEFVGVIEKIKLTGTKIASVSRIRSLGKRRRKCSTCLRRLDCWL